MGSPAPQRSGPAAPGGAGSPREPAPGTPTDPVTPAEGSEPAAGATLPRRRTGWLAATAVAVVASDVVSKVIVVATLSGRPPVTLVPGVLELTLTRNPGAAFSLAGGATVVLSLVALAVVGAIARTAPRLRSRAWAVVLGALLGGAVGNLVDRLFRDPAPLRGAVVDWIHLSHWPVFNVADSAIVLGGVAAVLLAARGATLDGSPTRS